MNQTEFESLAAWIFDALIAPAADPHAFPRQPDPALSSYFTTPVQTCIRREHFENPSFGSAEAFLSRLASTWEAEGNAHFLTMIPHLRRLCQLIEPDGETDEPTPFTYTMF